MSNSAIKFKYEGEEYILEYTRDVIKALERNHFNIQNYVEEPVSTADTLFKGAFLAKYRKLKESKIEEMWKSVSDKDGLLVALIELYKSTVDSFMDEPSEEEAKKSNWEKA